MESQEETAKQRGFPTELMSRTPRRVRMTGTGWFYALVSGVLSLLAAYFSVKIVRSGGSISSTLWILLCFPGLMGFMSFSFIRRFPLQRRVAINGLPAWASISTPEQMGPSKGPHWESYTFRSADGEMQYGRCLMDVGLRSGTTVCVLYLPNKPDISHIYPLDFFDIVQ